MTRVAVYAWVDLPDSTRPELRDGAENLLQDVVSHVPPLLGAAPGVLPRGEPAVRWFDLDVPLEVTAWRDGHVSGGPPIPETRRQPGCSAARSRARSRTGIRSYSTR